MRRGKDTYEERNGERESEKKMSRRKENQIQSEKPKNETKTETDRRKEGTGERDRYVFLYKVSRCDLLRGGPASWLNTH